MAKAKKQVKIKVKKKPHPKSIEAAVIRLSKKAKEQKQQR